MTNNTAWKKIQSIDPKPFEERRVQATLRAHIEM